MFDGPETAEDPADVNADTVEMPVVAEAATDAPTETAQA